MPPTRSLEQRIVEIAALATADPSNPTVKSKLGRALEGVQSLVVAAAAGVVARLMLDEMVPRMERAFERFLADGARTDKGCRAKIALVRALEALDADAGEVFARGLRHVQLEPVWGGREDTAGELRALCALALVRVRHPDMLCELARLLVDPERVARLGAARAIGCTGDEAGAPLLVHKVLVGDPEPEVFSECLASLIAVAPARGVAIAHDVLRGDDEAAAEAAAMALGQSRTDEAFAVLRAWCDEQVLARRRQVALIAIALLRTESGMTYLLGMVERGSSAIASQAIEALAVHRDDPAMIRRIRAAATARRDHDEAGDDADVIERAIVEAFGA